ncbi:MAG TPA: hypothetical protein ENF95_00500, partial [Candidatus Aenigmarchaeota archaeon]|nr:hypothetical protein [Candidatus Aenigmarchaeota archaeon]
MNHTLYVIPEDYSNLKVRGEGSYTYKIGTDEYGNRRLEILWRNFKTQQFFISMKVKNRAKFNGPKRVKFPFTPPKETFIYLTETENVKITDEIREKATELTQNCKDGFEAVRRISSWIYSNLDYDASFSGKILPSDIVFKIKKGTCDEFTNLFIAMCRSVGIPARYVGGLSYSKDGWGYHAWAEVYLGKWIPVDPTWNEVGWLDATHIEFGKFPDGGNVKVYTSYLSRGEERVYTSQPVPNVKISKAEPVKKIFVTDFETYPSVVGIGKSSVLTVRVRTLSKGCIATSLKIIPRVDEAGNPILSVSGEETISLCPGEEKTLHFILKVNDTLDERYEYYDLADVYTFLGEEKTIDLTVDPKRSGTSNIDLWVSSQVIEPGEKIKFYVNSNAPYKIFTNMNISNDTLFATEPGKYYIIAASEKGEVVKKEIEVKKNLTFKVKNLKKPEKVMCGEKFNVSFTIENLGENNFSIVSIQSSELSPIPKREFASKERKIYVTLTSSVKKNCTGRDQYIVIQINNQRIFEKIKVEKPKNLFESLWQEIESLVKKIINLI